MYGDFSDSEKSNDLATKFEINALYLLVIVSCVPCVDLEPLQSVLVVEIPGGVSAPKEKRSHRAWAACGSVGVLKRRKASYS